ncbi:hypothetical protein [Extibacter muris]|uniref:hypothetical protein n=1 Tax=Extibacter muris TaxID=1796622 RepID=UPI0021C954D9|nr:hypothetical protein [Extibacter muris]MCU0077923.1 hypothetical protein [Extibacter muris]
MDDKLENVRYDELEKNRDINTRNDFNEEQQLGRFREYLSGCSYFLTRELLKNSMLNNTYKG